jgi:hypothetical protein
MSLIDGTGVERLLLKNPAEYKAGFWHTYLSGGRTYRVGSAESNTISVVEQEARAGNLKLVLDHTPEGESKPRTRLTMDLWSRNSPTVLMRYSIKNAGEDIIEDMRVYLLMDFDIGGPTSYKDDTGRFEPETGLMMVYDENPLCVAIASRPRASGHEIASPTKLRIDEESRDLANNLELGPRDIATALQWNLGTLSPGESKAVDIVMASSTRIEEVRKLTESMWGTFDKKIQ